MNSGSKPGTQPIAREDLGSARLDNNDDPTSPSLPTTSHALPRKPSDPTLLSPGRQSVDTYVDEDEFKAAPPSPTLSSQSSVHFTTSTALRENKPSDHTTSLILLSQRDDSFSHSRHRSNPTTTSTDEGRVIDPDHSPQLSRYPTVSDATTVRPAVGTFNSRTPTQVGSVSDTGDSGRRKHKRNNARKKGKGKWAPGEGDDDGDDDDYDGEQVKLELTQDEDIDPAPFAFKPYHLASLVDPKNLEALETMGGINGLLAGLGVDPTNGLNTVGTLTPSEEGGGWAKSSHEVTAHTGSVEDRRRVYGSNTHPVHKSKSLLKLMWLTLEDKVLVSS